MKKMLLIPICLATLTNAALAQNAQAPTEQPQQTQIPTAQVQQTQPAQSDMETSRWHQAAVDKDGTFYYIDIPTIQRTLLSSTRRPGDPPPVQYTYWQKTKTPSGVMTNPTQATVSCMQQTINGAPVPPESASELIYQFFCLGPNAQNAVGYEQPVTPQPQPQPQQASQTVDPSAVTNTLWQGVDLIHEFTGY